MSKQGFNIFTPKNKVEFMLDLIGYKYNLFGKKILENSCGNGAFLTEIVRRYIEDCKAAKRCNKEIINGLERDIYAYEIDSKYKKECINNLNLITSSYCLGSIKWKVNKTDFLRTKIDIKFDFIIGNPPYKKYSEIDYETRDYIKEHFDVCKKGKFDYCYAFIEKSLNLLNEKGNFAYLIPSSIFKNVFANDLRRFILPNIVEIYDLNSEKVFNNVLVATSIFYCNKKFSQKYIAYYETGKNNKCKKILKSNLKDKWQFDSQKIVNNKIKVRFGDLFKASISIATLCNRIFVIQNYKENDEFVFFNENVIEKEITKVAVSPRSIFYKKKELIIFPYRYLNGIIVKYGEEEFYNKYPLAADYLLHNREILISRKSDKNSKWFEFGRNQALSHLNQPKLLLSTVITGNVKVYKLPKNYIPYAGIYIIPKTDKYSLDFAKSLLESDTFAKYVKNLGIHASGNSIRITSNDINNFTFDLEKLIKE